MLLLFGAVFAVGGAVGAGVGEQTESQQPATVQTTGEFDPGNVTVPEIAENAYGYGVVPEDVEAEPGDLIRTTVHAKDLGDGSDEVTGYDVDIAYDDAVLEYEGAISEATRLREEDGDFTASGGDGTVDVAWEPGFLDSVIDDLGENFIDGEGFGEIPLELFTLEFEVQEDAPTETSTELDTSPGDDPAMTSGWTSLFPWDTYDNDNIWWGFNEVRIVEDAGEDALEDAIATIEGTEQGGYTDFGEDNDPGEDAEVQFPDPDENDRVITVDGQVNDEGEWAANADDVFIPGLTVGPATADIEVLGDGFEGQIDREAEEMTLEGEFRAEALGDDFEFAVELTSEESGELAGDAEFDLDEDYTGTGSARLVDNEFIVPEPSGNDQIDDRLDLEDADEEGANYFIFEFDFEFNEAVDDPALIDGTVEGDDGEPLANAEVELVDDGEVVDFTFTDEEGNYELDGIRPGTYELRADATGYFEESTTVELDGGAELTEPITLEAGETDFAVEIEQLDDIEEGDTAILQAEIENVGTGIGEQTVELVADGETVDEETVDLGLESPDDRETVTLQWETEEGDAGDYTVSVESETDADEAELTVAEDDGDGIDAVFTAESTPGGFISFAEDNLDEAIEEGLDLPPESDDIVIEGEIEDGEWESTAVSFPALDADGIEAEVDVPFGFEGEIDRENDEMTFEGQLDVTIEEFDATFSFEVAATTGESGVLDGDAEFTEEGGSVNVVDNEYAVEDETGTEVDDELDIPSESGENWIDLNLDFDVTEVEGDGPATGDLDGTVVDESGDPVEDATVDVADSPAAAETDSDGSYELTALDAETLTITADADGYLATTVDVDVLEDETVTQEIEIEEGETDFAVEIEQLDDIEEGDTAILQAPIENIGTGIGEQTIELVADGETVDEETVELGLEEPSDRETVTLEWDTEEGDAGEYTLSVESEDDAADRELTVAEADDEGVDATFTATSTAGGFISFDEDTVDSAMAEGLDLPPEAENIVIEGEIDDGEWESTAVSFPSLDADGIEAEVDVPFGFEGEIDRETDEMTFEGQLDVTIDQFDATFSFDVAGTTDTSGDLSGDADLGEEGGEVTIVDNEYAVDDETGTAVDSELGLPSGSGQNWIELNLDLDITEGEAATGDLEGTVVDQDGDAVEDATVEVDGTPVSDTTDSDGSYELDDLDVGTQTVTADAEEYFENSVEVEITEDETTTQEIEIEKGEAEFELTVEDDSVIAGETLEPGAIVENDGNAPGEAEIELRTEAADGDLLSAAESTATIEPEESESISDTFRTSEQMAGDAVIILEVNDQTEEVEIEIEEPLEDDDGPDAIFTAENTGEGYISFDEDTEDVAIEEGLEFPEGEIVIEGEIFDDRWQSTGVEFPTLETDTGIEAGVDVEDFSGDIDTDAETMTAGGDLEVTILEEDNPSFEFSIDTTTGDSNTLSGSADIAEDGGTAMLVDNEYTVTDETGSFVDGVLGLPLTDPGQAWIVLELDLDIEDASDGVPESGAIEGVVESEDGEPIEDASVDVDGELQDTTTASDGAYSLDSVDVGTQTLVVDAEGYEETTVDVEIDAEETTEQSITLEAGDPAFEADVDADTAEPGETTTVTGTVENVGDGPGEEEVTLQVAGESESETFSLGVGESESLSLDWVAEEEDEYEAEFVVGDERTSAATDIEIEEDDAEQDEDGDFFTATSTGGFISFAEDNLDEAIEEGLDLPPAGDSDETIEIAGQIDDDNTWESTSIEFPDLETDDGIGAEVDAPDGLSGEIDPDTGEMTASGELQVVVDDDPEFSFSIDLSTTDSGDLTGEADFDEESGTVTLVDNEFTVEDETGNGFVDGALDLPATEPGENWFELELDLELDASEEDTANVGSGGDGSDDGSGDGEDGDEDDGTFITSLGLLGGIVGIGAAGTLVVGSLAGRFLSAVDPDPET